MLVDGIYVLSMRNIRLLITVRRCSGKLWSWVESSRYAPWYLTNRAGVICMGCVVITCISQSLDFTAGIHMFEAVARVTPQRTGKLCAASGRSTFSSQH